MWTRINSNLTKLSMRVLKTPKEKKITNHSYHQGTTQWTESPKGSNPIVTLRNWLITQHPGSFIGLMFNRKYLNLSARVEISHFMLMFHLTQIDKFIALNLNSIRWLVNRKKLSQLEKRKWHQGYCSTPTGMLSSVRWLRGLKMVLKWLLVLGRSMIIQVRE